MNTHTIKTMRIARVEIFRLRANVARGPESSLGNMPARRGCLLRIEDEEGAYGWGEIWCNFPPHGAESRAYLFEDAITPLLASAAVSSWDEWRPALTDRLMRTMIHTGEAGAFLHCLAGLDMAVADLAARRAGLPMVTFLGGKAGDVKVYASTPSGADLPEQCVALLAAGHTAIKLKVGYDPAVDLLTVANCRRAVGDEIALMVDANQAWSLERAIVCIEHLSAHHLEFVEEPIRADESVEIWSNLSKASSVPLAAGENIGSEGGFEALLAPRALQVVQPDVAKWGGVSGAIAVGLRAQTHGARCCMHFMGTGLGLAASLHCLAAIGGDGWVELDANENPLRTDLGALDLRVRDGRVQVPPGVGFGFEPDPEALRRLSG